MQEERVSPPEIDRFKKPIYTKSEIEKILPHRDPFLLIDNIFPETMKNIDFIVHAP